MLLMEVCLHAPMKKFLLTFCLFCLGLTGQAQNFEEDWEGFFSYNSVKSITQGNEKVFVAGENSVFIYDLFSQQIETLSTINGLSGETITEIYYSEAFETLLIGYENGLIDLVKDGQEDVLAVVDILEKLTIPPDQKRINHFEEYNGFVYISTQFGISVYDLNRLEFGDSYFIGNGGSQINISQTAIQEPYIYAATTAEGVKRAMVDDDDLIDYQNWSQITTGNIRAVETLGSELYIARLSQVIESYTPADGFQFAGSANGPVLDFQTAQDVLAVTTPNSITSYGPGFVQLAQVSSLPDFDFELQSGLSFGQNSYLGTLEDGLLIVPYNTSNATQVLPDGPLSNQAFTIDASPGALWVGFGAVDVNFNPFPLSRIGISNLKVDEGWNNIPYEDLPERATDLVEVNINPSNPQEVHFSSYIGGVLEVINGNPTTLYNETNSSLEVPNNNPDIGIRAYGSAYDRDGNLWFVQSRTDEGLIRKAGATFGKIDFSDVIAGSQIQALTELAISREGYVFFGTTSDGMVGFNPTNGALNRIDEGTGNGNLSNRNVRALAFDNQNRLWIGSLSGLRVLFTVGSFFDEGAVVEAQPIIILEDGVPQELLFEQSITDIEVDGSNNKWISTATSGVFYLSSNGQETLRRFTEDNSPLPTNNVQDIAIDSESGRVYFATEKGLVAFEGTSTAPRDNLENVYAYPNPVRPNYTGDVTIDGLTARANVKITDIEGNLVYETTSEGGSVLWDTTAFGRYRVASGVYIVMVTAEDALETTITKIMVVR